MLRHGDADPRPLLNNAVDDVLDQRLHSLQSHGERRGRGAGNYLCQHQNLTAEKQKQNLSRAVGARHKVRMVRQSIRCARVLL